MINRDIVLVGVDWGTTHRRAYALDARGVCIAEHADDEGALACKNRFPQALKSLLAGMGAEPAQVVMSGMVGSALGWVTVPYASADVALTQLRQHLHAVSLEGSNTKVAIVPGYCIRDASGQPDVMRGEETQLLGAVHSGHVNGWFLLPGTHSKWVHLEQGRVTQLRTYLTGELFNLLSQHGTLAAAASNVPAAWDAEVFRQGVDAARASQGALSHQLFGCRARVVSGDMPPAAAHAYLSGLLIGAEFHDVLGASNALPDSTPIQVIASPALVQHYQAAASHLGLTLQVLDARAIFIAAIHALRTFP